MGVAVEESVDEEQSVVLAKQAVKHFTDMEALDVAPSSKGNVDVFITVHARVRGGKAWHFRGVDG